MRHIGLLVSGCAFLTLPVVGKAADLPSRKAAPAEYVKICDAYGSGFSYIPGTDTCLKVGGYVRAEYAYVSPGNIFLTPAFKAATPVAAAGNSTFVPSGTIDQTGFMARGRVDLDARTQTPFGTARTFISLRGQNSTGVYYNGDNALNGLVVGQSGATAVTLENAVVQFAGFTFGRTTTDVFSFIPTSLYWNAQEWAGFPSGVNLLSYTATFGGGLSATVAAEDRAGLQYASNPGYVSNSPTAGIVGSSAFAAAGSGVTGGAVSNGPFTWPALVGNLRLDQGWGAIQVMGSVVQNAATTTFAGGGAPNVTLTQTGYALGAGIKVNLPFIAANDTLYLTGAYANGNLDEIATYSTSAATNFMGREFTGLIRTDRNIYVTPSGSFAPATCGLGTASSGCFRTEQTTGYSFGGVFTHYWTSTIRSSLLGSFLSLSPGTQTRNTDWTLGGLSDATVLRIGGQVVWSPIKDIDLGAELTYQSLRAKLTGSNGAAPSCAAGSLVACPASSGAPNASSDVIQARLRVQRTF